MVIRVRREIIMTAQNFAYGSNASINVQHRVSSNQRGSRALLALSALIAIAATPLATSAFAIHQDGAEMRARQALIVDGCRTGATRACGEIAQRAPAWSAYHRAATDRALSAFGLLAVAAGAAAGASAVGRRNRKGQAALRTVTTPAE